MPAHILVVDGDPEVLAILKDLIESLGYEVSTATSGLQALAALQPDAIVTDLTIPAISGAQFLDRVKAVRPQVPVIVTAAAIDPAVVRTRSHGAPSSTSASPSRSSASPPSWLRRCARDKRPRGAVGGDLGQALGRRERADSVSAP